MGELRKTVDGPRGPEGVGTGPMASVMGSGAKGCKRHGRAKYAAQLISNQ